MEKGTAHCGWCHSWTGGPLFYKKAGQVNSTTPWPLHQLLPPGFCPVWIPVLTSFSDKQQCGSVSWINPFFPRLLWSWGFITAIVTLTLGHVLVMSGQEVSGWAISGQCSNLCMVCCFAAVETCSSHIGVPSTVFGFSYSRSQVIPVECKSFENSYRLDL